MTREDVKYFANCLKNNYKMDFNTMEMFCNAVIESQNKLQKIENIMNEMSIDTIVKKLEKETVSRESYDHDEYFLRKKVYKLDRLLEQANLALDSIKATLRSPNRDDMVDKIEKIVNKHDENVIKFLNSIS